MKQGNLEKWSDCISCENLLFFSELVNELLFDYSIPSNRVATLNTHFLCIDAMSAINAIENNGVPEGTLKPIVEELFTALKVDPVFESVDNTPLNFFVKSEKNGFRIVNNIGELNYQELKIAVTSIYTLYFNDNKYYNDLKEQVIKIIKSNDNSQQLNLFRLTKSLLTEIINIGYSHQYIYYVMDNHFWNSKSSVDSPDQIELFFDEFPMQRKKFDVYFLVDNNKIYQYVKYIDRIKMYDELEAKCNSHKEKQFLQKRKNQSYIAVSVDAYDYYTAAADARNMLSLDISIYRLYNHEYRYNINTVKCGVYEGSVFYRVSSPKSAVSHKKMPSSKQIKENMAISEKAIETALKKSFFDLPFTLIKAVEFHSHSLDSISKENQLLDFWAIFESVLNISSKHTTDRIQQVCMYLVPILKRKYIFSLFEQLAADIKAYSDNDYKSIIGDAKKSKDIVQKMCEFILLEENIQKKNEFITNCKNYPLLKERIVYYSNTLNSPKSIYSFVEKHANRVQWQIMRIYRNRNLIIHNGESMPYLNLLIENLHSYVDEFIEYVFNSVSNGNTIESMCQELFIKECQWNAKFSKNKGGMDSEIIKEMLSY
jgi:hypothetical protein